MAPQALVFLVAGAGVPGLVAGGSLTTLGTLLSGAIGLGISFGISQLAVQNAPKPKEVKGVFQQDVPVRTKHYGRLRVGGKRLFMETINGDLYHVIYFGEGPIDGVEEYYADDRVFEINPDGTAAGDALNNPFVDLDGDNHITLKFKLGTPGQAAFEDLVALAPTIWTTNHRARGCVVAFLRQGMTSQKSFGKIWPNRYAELNFVERACRVFDPRAGERRWFDPSDVTKNPGRNLPLILREYLTDPDGAQIEAEYLEDDPEAYGNFCHGADIADEILPTKGGGTTHRYYGQFSYDFDSQPGDNIKRLLQACAGRLFLKPNGKIGFYPGEWREPTHHITLDHMIAYDLRDRSGPLRDANEIVVRYTKPLSRYGEGTSDPWRDEDDISQSGLVKSTPLEIYEAQDHNHARRLAKIESHRRNPRWQGTIRTNLYGMNCWDEWTILLSIPYLDIEAESFEVLGISLDDDRMEVTMEIASLTAEAFEFDAETEEGTEPVDPADLDPQNTPEPVNLQAYCEQRKVATGISVAALVATWEEDENFEGKARRLEPDAEYSIADADQWFPMVVAASHLKAEVVGVADRDAAGNQLFYDVRVRWNLPSGSPGNYELVENIPAVSDATPPIPAASIDAVRVGSNVQVTLAVAENGDNASKARIYRATGAGSTFGSAAPVSGLLAVSAGVNRTWSDTTVSSGTTYRYWVVLLNGSGVASTQTGPATVAIPA